MRQRHAGVRPASDGSPAGATARAAPGQAAVGRPSRRWKLIRAAGRPRDAVAALVEQPVVVSAELEQVLEVGRAAVGPVLDVVGVQIAP